MKKRALIINLIMSALLLSSCGKAEEIPPVAIETEASEMSYTFSYAAIDDVSIIKKLKCTYVQTNEQEVSFDVTGKYVDKVYVKSGDTVKKGDLLCELSSESLQNSIDSLEYKIKKNELKLSYLDNQELLDRQDIWIANIYYGQSLEATNEKLAQLEKNYESQRISYKDALEFDKEELSLKKKELNNSRLYATMDGVVMDLKSDLEGSTSKEGDVIMKIVDSSDCLFEISEPDYMNYFNEGDIVTMTIVYTSAAGDYELTPYEIDSWTLDKQVFEVISSPDNVSIEVGTTGTIKLTTELKEDVLSLPTECVHEANEEAYVYVMNDDGMREVKWIKIGLIGDSKTEILEGLNEGDKVIKK